MMVIDAGFMTAQHPTQQRYRHQRRGSKPRHGGATRPRDTPHRDARPPVFGPPCLGLSERKMGWEPLELNQPSKLVVTNNGKHG